MRDYNTIIKEKTDILNNDKETIIMESYKKLLNKLYTDKKIISVNDLSESERESLQSNIDKFFNIDEGLTLEGEKYLNNNSNLLTEKSTKDERKKFLMESINDSLSKSFYVHALKEGIYSSINDLYEGVGAKNLTDVMCVTELENVICESINNYIRETLIAEFRNEINV